MTLIYIKYREKYVNVIKYIKYLGAPVKQYIPHPHVMPVKKGLFSVHMMAINMKQDRKASKATEIPTSTQKEPHSSRLFVRYRRRRSAVPPVRSPVPPVTSGNQLVSCRALRDWWPTRFGPICGAVIAAVLAGRELRTAQTS